VKVLRTFKADLHIHTCLSPCGELSMSPRNIILRAVEEKIDILGICDHNSAENVPALLAIAKTYPVTIFPGMEITSQEEIHILGLFDNLEAVLQLQEEVYHHLPGENDEEAFGLQVVVNEQGEVLRFNPRLLIGACTLSLNQIVDLIHSFKGLAIASHIDRESFSLISQLGFIPSDIILDALEISPSISYYQALNRFAPHLPLVSFSDAHRPEEIGQSFTRFLIQEASLTEIRLALRNQQGRRVIH